MSELRTRNVFGRRSFLMKTRCVELALTVTGGHLAPVTFYPQEAHPIQPYAIAPWWDEPLDPATPPLLATLRGDFFCSAFGSKNAALSAGKTLPPHGETANSMWHAMGHGSSTSGCWLQLGMALSGQGGHCHAVTALVSDQPVIYQRHDLSRLTGPINPGHHATLAFPAMAGAGRLSFSRLKSGFTYPEPLERAETGGQSSLQPDVEISDLHQVPCIDGSMADLTRFPARPGFEDLAILCADPTVELAWSAVTFPEQGYVWFSLRDPRRLSCTLLWFSNGGRNYPPWNGRHCNVMGIEDMTGYFDIGLAASCRRNRLTERGVRTCLERDEDGRISIPYIQGVARIPRGFDRVATIEAPWAGDRILLRADCGLEVSLPCHAEFLKTGQIAQLPHLPPPSG